VGGPSHLGGGGGKSPLELTVIFIDVRHLVSPNPERKNQSILKRAQIKQPVAKRKSLISFKGLSERDTEFQNSRKEARGTREYLRPPGVASIGASSIGVPSILGERRASFKVLMGGGGGRSGKRVSAFFRNKKRGGVRNAGRGPYPNKTAGKKSSCSDKAGRQMRKRIRGRGAELGETCRWLRPRKTALVIQGDYFDDKGELEGATFAGQTKKTTTRP